MISASQLRELIETYQHQPAIFSSELDEPSRSAMADVSEFTFLYLEHLATELEAGLTETEVHTKLNVFFANRWAVIRDSNITYTRHPFLPANQICLKLAAAIASPTQSICSMLMPNVDTLNRPSFSFKAETEEDGAFLAEEFILSQSGTKLIPVAEIFQTAKFNTNAIFPDFQPDTSEVQYELKTRDFLRLEKVAGTASEHYMRLIRQRHAASFDNGSVGFAIKTLAIALQKGSVHGAGTEMVANHDIIDEPIKTFYDMWRGLPEDTRTQVCNYQLLDWGYANRPIDSYFLTLFAGHDACPITEAESERVKQDNIFRCMFQLSLILDEHLTQHQALYSIPILSGQVLASTSNTVPDDIDERLQQALDALKTRPQLVEGDDRTLPENLFRYLIDGQSLPPAITDIFSEKLFLHIVHTYNPNQSDLSNAKFFLYQRMIARVSPDKLNTWIPDGSLRLWMSWFSEQQQVALVELRFEEFLPDCENEEEYEGLDYSMSLAASKRIKQLFVQKMSTNLSTHDELCQLIKTRPYMANEIVKYLHDRFNSEAFVYDDIFFILTALNGKKKQRQFFERHAADILPLIDPQRYTSLLKVMKEKDWFRDELATHIAASVTNLDVCLKMLRVWNVEDALKIQLLSHLPFTGFIHSRDDLKQLLNLVPRGKINSVLERFDSDMLHCTRGEWSKFIMSSQAVKHSKSAEDKLRQDLQLYLAEACHGSGAARFFGGSEASRQSEANKLLQILEDPGAIYEDIRDVVKQTRDRIGAAYMIHSPNKSQMYRILSDFLTSTGEMESYASTSMTMV